MAVSTSEREAARAGEPARPAARPRGSGGGTRLDFIDQFRGLVGVLMLFGHSGYYFNAVWLSLSPEDPFFSSMAQFVLRYVGYLCAPGFLMMNGAMVWYSYTRRRAAAGRVGVRWAMWA